MNVFYLIISSFKILNANSFYLLVQDMGVHEVSEPFNYTNLIIYIIVGLSLLFNIVVLLSKKNRRKGNKYDKPEVNYEDWYNKEKNKNSQLNNEIRNLKNKIFSLENKRVSNYEEKKDSQVEGKMQSSLSSPTIEQQYEDEKPKTFDLEITKPQTIYLPSPFENNRFSIEDVSNEQMPTSLYQIILDASNTTGKLLIIENADFTRALNSPDHYLEKACIYENAFSPNANGINIVEPGRVKLENQDWLIIQKIKIKFI
ncbi:hypothetical protein D778_02653 [Xanthomarina gelatinilytica]|uniref:Uncharacterized protein n=2 Tax=Xanthomarina gelatinilytica TaxID=1137281 RepID=M7MJX0_9FLAO|nr:hypothetical protein [Xanthomarina gelatinilytica]EMQ95351.1 hypothetical protein D778_02653 [Xanthomarina gelatinilytica]